MSLNFHNPSTAVSNNIEFTLVSNNQTCPTPLYFLLNLQIHNIHFQHAIDHNL